MKTLLLVFGLFGGLFGNGVEENQVLAQDSADCEVVLTAEQLELKAYAEEILAGYDLESMTRDELFDLHDEVSVLVAEKAVELGIELPIGDGNALHGEGASAVKAGADVEHGNMTVDKGRASSASEAARAYDGDCVADTTITDAELA